MLLRGRKLGYISHYKNSVIRVFYGDLVSFVSLRFLIYLMEHNPRGGGGGDGTLIFSYIRRLG